jgi:hypothetical protein
MEALIHSQLKRSVEMKTNDYLARPDMTKAIAFFSILMGLAQVATWVVLFSLGKVPEIVTQPFGTWMLLAAEFLTGVSLVFGGHALLTRQSWGLRLELAALGMLLYCTVYSTGVFGQQGNIPAAAFFAVVALLSALSVGAGLTIQGTR